MPDRNVRGKPLGRTCWRRARRCSGRVGRRPHTAVRSLDRIYVTRKRQPTACHSVEFRDATKAKEVRERALFMIAALNGARNSLGPTGVDGVVEVQPDGKLHHTLFAARHKRRRPPAPVRHWSAPAARTAPAPWPASRRGGFEPATPSAAGRVHLPSNWPTVVA